MAQSHSAPSRRTRGDELTRSDPSNYDTIGKGYTRHRVSDPRIAAQIEAALEGASSVCNVGAGAGAYEPVAARVVALEPSREMLAQHSAGARVRGVAEALPFPDAAFDATLAVLTVHHWRDARAGLAELRRIAPLRVVFSFDPSTQDDFWLVRDYVPEAAMLELRRAPEVEQVADWLGGTTRVEVIPVPWDCPDGFQAAYWRRPERYLEAGVREGISTLAQLPPRVVERGMARLADDLRTGFWAERNPALADRESMDWGYRLIVSRQ